MDPIDGALGLPEVPPLAARLLERLKQGDVTLDLRNLTGIDTAALQLLLSARVEAAACGRSFTVQMPQDGAVPALMAQLGLKHASGKHAFEAAGRADSPEQEMTR